MRLAILKGVRGHVAIWPADVMRLVEESDYVKIEITEDRYERVTDSFDEAVAEINAARNHDFRKLNVFYPAEDGTIKAARAALAAKLEKEKGWIQSRSQSQSQSQSQITVEDDTE